MTLRIPDPGRRWTAFNLLHFHHGLRDEHVHLDHGDALPHDVFDGIPFLTSFLLGQLAMGYTYMLLNIDNFGRHRIETS